MSKHYRYMTSEVQVTVEMIVASPTTYTYLGILPNYTFHFNDTSPSPYTVVLLSKYI